MYSYVIYKEALFMSIRIGIIGYGNLGRGVECAIKQNKDMELVAVFTRRAPETVKILTDSAKVVNVADIADWKDKIDVAIAEVISIIKEKGSNYE